MVKWASDRKQLEVLKVALKRCRAKVISNCMRRVKTGGKGAVSLNPRRRRSRWCGVVER